MRLPLLPRIVVGQRRRLAFPATTSTALYIILGSSIPSLLPQALSFDSSLSSPVWRRQGHQQQQRSTATTIRFFFTPPALKMNSPSTATATTRWACCAAVTSSSSDNNNNNNAPKNDNDDKKIKRSDSMGSNSSSSRSGRSISEFDEHLRMIHLPCREYGYRTVPMDWEELTQIIEVEQNLAKLSRSVAQQYEYEIYQRDLKKHWQSVIDHILCDKFNFEQKTNPDNGLYYAYPRLTEVKEVRKALVRNDFPYYLADDVEHWVLWKLGQDCTEEDVERAKQEIQRKLLLNVKDFLYYINPPHLKSLPEIDHVHILVKTDKEPSTTTTTSDED